MSNALLPVLLIALVAAPPTDVPDNAEEIPSAKPSALEQLQKDIEERRSLSEEIRQERLKPIGERDEEKSQDLEEQQKAARELQRVRRDRPGETVDPVSGRTNLHFTRNVQPEDVVRMKAQKNLGIVFFGHRNTCSDESLRLLQDVPMTGLAVWTQPVTNAGFKIFEKHPTLEHVSIMEVTITDAIADSLVTIPNLKKITFGRVAVTDETLKKLSKLERLENLHFFKCPQITDQGVRQIEALSGLKRLFLNNNPQLTSSIFPTIGKLTKLERVELDEIQLNEADLSEFSRLQNLEYLSIHETALTDRGISHIVKLKGLKTLGIGGTKITDAGVAQLRELKNLESISLGRTAVTDAGVKHLANHSKLLGLGLNETAITDAAIADLRANNANLQGLRLEKTKITDNAIPDLLQLRSLTSINLTDADMTDEGIERVRKAFPKSHIIPFKSEREAATIR